MVIYSLEINYYYFKQDRSKFQSKIRPKFIQINLMFQDFTNFIRKKKDKFSKKRRRDNYEKGWQPGGDWNGQMGFIHNQEQHGNQKQGLQWLFEQGKRNQFNILNIGSDLNIKEMLEQQIVYLEPSPTQQKLQQLRKRGEVFLDERFPPNENSLTGQYGPQSSWSKINWGKATQEMPGCKIFQGKVQPGDIKQGYLGDCYFLAALAALAERPDRIFQLFLLQEQNPQKYYSVKMLYKGKWVVIDMDQFVPFMYGKPAFTKAKDEQLWVVLLQKAWAKLYTSYKRIEAGYPEEGLHDLTGAPIKNIYFQQSGFNSEKQWEYLLQASRLQYSMIASSQPGSDTTKSFSGIVNGHAYTVLNLTYLSFNGSKVRIVQLRNPWGKGQSKSDWNDADPKWNYVSSQEKQRVGFHPDVDDGIFFMSYEQFVKELRALTVAQINDAASYVYKSAKDPSNKGVFFRVTIYQKGEYSFQVDKTPQRSYTEQIQNKFRYPNARIDLAKIQGGWKGQKYEGGMSSRRTLFKQYILQPGTYIAKVNIDYDKSLQKEFDVNLAVYSDPACLIQFATRQQAILMTGDQSVQWQGIVQQPKKAWNSMGNFQFEKKESYNKGWQPGGNWSGQGGQGGNQGGWGGQQQGGGDGWGGQGGNQGGWGGQQQGGGDGWGGQGGHQGGWGGQQQSGGDGWGDQGGQQGGWGGHGHGHGNRGKGHGHGHGRNDGW